MFKTNNIVIYFPKLYKDYFHNLKFNEFSLDILHIYKLWFLNEFSYKYVFYKIHWNKMTEHNQCNSVILFSNKTSLVYF